MILYLIGIDHSTASLPLRERFYHQRKDMEMFWKGRGQTVLFSTCNRIEIYAVAENGDQAIQYMQDFHQRFPVFARNAYMRLGVHEVIRHALELAVGMRSQLKGEEQIREQLIHWIERDVPQGFLRIVWDKVIDACGELRSRSGLAAVSYDVARLVFDDIHMRVGHKVKQYEIVVLGTGKVASICAVNRQPDMQIHFVSRKRQSRARVCAQKTGGKAMDLEELKTVIMHVDALITATGSPHYVLKEKWFDEIDLSCRQTPLLIYDLAFPRDVDPLITKNEMVKLQNLDDLKCFFSQCNHRIETEIGFLTEYIDDAVEQIKRELKCDAYTCGNSTEPVGVATG